MTLLVLGYGSAGRRHALAAKALGCTVAVYDPDTARHRVARGDGFAVVERGFDEADAVVCASPARCHADDMERHHARPMLVEKPLATSTAEVRSMRRRPANLWVAYNWRYHAQARAALTTSAGPFWFTCDTDMAQWPGQSYCDPLLECSHEIDLIRWRRAGATTLWHGVRNKHGALLQFTTGDAVSVRWDTQDQGRAVHRPEGVAWLDLGEPLRESYRLQMDRFCGWVRRGCVEPAECAFVDGVAVLDICEQVRR